MTENLPSVSDFLSAGLDTARENPVTVGMLWFAGIASGISAIVLRGELLNSNLAHAILIGGLLGSQLLLLASLQFVFPDRPDSVSAAIRSVIRRFHVWILIQGTSLSLMFVTVLILADAPSGGLFLGVVVSVSQLALILALLAVAIDDASLVEAIKQSWSILSQQGRVSILRLILITSVIGLLPLPTIIISSLTFGLIAALAFGFTGITAGISYFSLAEMYSELSGEPTRD